MKKILFLSTIFISSLTPVNAQFKVDSNGLVGIGGNTDSEYKANITGSGKSLRCYRSGTSGTWANVIESQSVQPTGTMAVAVMGSVHNTALNGTSGRSYGVMGRAAHATTGWNYAVIGQLGGTANGAAIYGTTSFSDYGFSLPDRYAGYFRGPVKIEGDLTVTGSIYGVVLSPNSCNLDRSVAPYNSGNRIVSQLNGLDLQESFITPLQSQSVNRNADRTDADTIDAPVELEASMLQKQIASKRHFGLAADQLEEIFPDLVYEDENGIKSINYVEMVPILVQAINELKEELDELKGENISKKKSQATNVGNTEQEIIQLSLGQNKPNPFGVTTTIDVSVPETVQNAFIYVYDLQGKKVDQVDITARGKQSIQLSSANLSDGMYLYSLIADGKVVETRRMIVGI